MIAEEKAAARCHWHTLMESVGTCAACGLAGCGTCLVQEAGGYRCQQCIRKRRPIIVQSAPVRHLPQLDMPAPVIPSTALPALSMPPIQPPSFPASPEPEPLRVLPPQPVHRQSGTSYARILVSLALFVAGAMIPVSMTNQEGELVELTLKQHLLIGYVLWALFWGAPAAWRLWRQLIFNPSVTLRGGCSPVGLAGALTSILLLVLGGWFYCLFGGGIYQFLKHWWSVSRTA